VTRLVVVDTNVPLAANYKADASPDCVQKCVEALTEIMADKQALVIDDSWRIIREYMNKLSQSGQPGVGDRFLKWVLTNQANPSRCVQVTITPRSDDKDHFKEFPDDPGLISFDRADRKFVAVACAHLERPPILRALDTKWWGWKEALERVGVTVMFLCQDEIQARYEQKFGQRRGRKRRPTRGR
jgi:hypothetical protein